MRLQFGIADRNLVGPASTSAGEQPKTAEAGTARGPFWKKIFSSIARLAPGSREAQPHQALAASLGKGESSSVSQDEHETSSVQGKNAGQGVAPSRPLNARVVEKSEAPLPQRLPAAPQRSDLDPSMVFAESAIRSSLESKLVPQPKPGNASPKAPTPPPPDNTRLLFSARPETVRREDGTVLVHPMPKMSSQFGKFGVMGVVDLNCGWYCEQSVLRYWHQRLQGEEPKRVDMAKPTLFGYDPETHSSTGNIFNLTKPERIEHWEHMLKARGPLIASGKVGAAYWGSIGKHAMGVGHYVLIVGANAQANTLTYKDPLTGNKLKTEDFDSLMSRLDQNLSYIPWHGAPDALQADKVRIKPKTRPKPLG